jgi:hypothetical protein
MSNPTGKLGWLVFDDVDNPDRARFFKREPEDWEHQVEDGHDNWHPAPRKRIVYFEVEE